MGNGAMDEIVLELLRRDPPTFVSGESIRRHLKVSRTAVWKRIEALRAQGYKIEASRRLGYRLLRSPDLLTPSEVRPALNTQWMGHKIHYYPTLDSTNTEAYQLALRGAREGEIVIAESQKKGRGRLGRPWFSPPYLNLNLSVILRPPIPPSQASVITLLAAVATAEAIEQISGISPTIKWPNDLLVGGRKIAGLLNEIHSEADRIHFVILGIGVNLNVAASCFPEKIRSIATSLKRETGRPVSRKIFLSSLLKALEAWYQLFLKEGNPPILRAWKQRAQIEGKPVKVTSFGETLWGTAVDVDSDGRLLIRTREGILRRIVAGDVEYPKNRSSGLRAS